MYIPSACTEGDILLLNGSTPLRSEGRVEMCTDNEYRSVCNLFFDEREAQVICRQLEFSQPDTSKSVFKLILSIINNALNVIYSFILCTRWSLWIGNRSHDSERVHM